MMNELQYKRREETTSKDILSPAALPLLRVDRLHLTRSCPLRHHSCKKQTPDHVHVNWTC